LSVLFKLWSSSGFLYPVLRFVSSSVTMKMEAADSFESSEQNKYIIRCKNPQRQ
jgi:hypothetical protein